VAALERGLRLLAAFNRQTPVMTLAELAARAGLNISTIVRLMVSLERLNFISRDSEGVYRFGAEVWRIGMMVDQELNLQHVVPPELEKLCARVKESVPFWCRPTACRRRACACCAPNHRVRCECTRRSELCCHSMRVARADVQGGHL
jgi:DNA-binding IclR family transcriptional regulator